MGEFASQIFKGTPFWVWIILVLLVGLGLRQLKPRTVKRHTVLIAPIVFLLVGLMGAGRGPVGLTAWALMLFSTAVATFFIWQPKSRVRFDSSSDRLTLPGSIVPLLLMLAIFLLNYVINVTLAIHPALKSTLFWQVGPALLLGALSGIFMGRAATLFGMNRQHSISLAA